jgi:hypothetical protein
MWAADQIINGETVTQEQQAIYVTPHDNYFAGWIIKSFTAKKAVPSYLAFSNLQHNCWNKIYFLGVNEQKIKSKIA